ncbi:MAG: Maf-like protein [Schleiferiaceae bacterium]
MGFSFEIRVADIDESAPENLSGEETVEHIALEKAKALSATLQPGEVLITSDTEVWMDGQRFGKPQSSEHAVEMLQRLSGKTHQVISGICLMDSEKHLLGHEVTHVTFRDLTPTEIKYYVDHHKPLDKAGAYGIQEYIGMIGIEKIEGNYFNVVGLPTYTLNRLQSEYLATKTQ